LGQQSKATELLKLEKELNNVFNVGIPIGGLLANSFAKINKNQKLLPLKHRLGIYKNVIKNLIFGSNGNHLFRNKTIITKHGANAHLNKMMDPLLKHWGKQSVLFQSNEVPTSSTSIIISFQSSGRLSRTSQFKVIKEWVLIKKKIKRSIYLSPFNNYKNELECVLLIQLCKVQFWIDSFEQEAPTKVVTDYDRGHHTAPLVLVANKFNVPTIVIQHGVISPPYGFVPLLAKKVCVWGEIQKKQYIEAGERSEKIYITGTPIIDLNTDGQKRPLVSKETHGFDTNKKLIAIGINPIETVDLKKFISNFLAAIKDNEHIEGVIKLHPAQSKAYINSIYDCPNNIRLIDKSVPNEIFFGLIDGLIIHNSGLGIEAALLDIPVAIYSNLDCPLGFGQVMIDNFFAIEMCSIQEIKKWVNKILLGTNPKLKSENQNLFYHSTSTNASKNILKVIENNIPFKK